VTSFSNGAHEGQAGCRGRGPESGAHPMLNFKPGTFPSVTLQIWARLVTMMEECFLRILRGCCLMRSPRFCRTVMLSIVFAFGACATSIAQTPVEPLIQKYCLGCHNQTDRKAGLSLQTREELLKGGDDGPVLGADFAKSRLLAVLNTDSDTIMPPEDEPQPTNLERERLRNWVLEGAKMKPIAVGNPTVPTIKPFQKARQPLLSSATINQDGALVLGGRGHVTAIDTDGSTLWRTEAGIVNVLSLSAVAAKRWVVAATGTPGALGKAIVLDATDGKLLHEFGGHTDAIYAAAVDGDGKVLATAGYDRRIVLHDVATGRVIRVLQGHNGSIFSLSFDPSGNVLCSASADGTVKVWSVATGQRLDTLSQPQAEQYTVIVSPDGQRIFAAGADNRIRIWKLLSLMKPRINPLVVSRFAHEQAISRIALSADGQLLASSAEDGSLRIWRAFPLQPLQAMPQQPSHVTSLSFVGNKQIFVTRIDGTSEQIAINAVGDSAASATSPASAATTAEPATAEEARVLNEIVESDNNDEPASSQTAVLPFRVAGVIKPDGGNDRDADCYRFTASAGQQLVLEVSAEGDNPPLDSRIEVLTQNGEPIIRTVLQAVRDSYFTFRGKDSDTIDDFRVFNWQEMELNEYLYSDGEVVKLWLYPRGPDSGFKVYPGFGKRFTYFGTTPISHALQAPCFVVVPRAPGEALTPNGLPTFPVYYQNDDDPRRALGRNARLTFTAPGDDDYVVRVTDSRGFSGKDFGYTLTVRPPRPRYEVSVSTKKISVAPGTGTEIVFTAKRIDEYDGPIPVNISGLPPGFGFSGPLVIQSEQFKTSGTLYATEAAVVPTAQQLDGIEITAGELQLGKLEELKLTKDPKLRFRIEADSSGTVASSEPLVLQIRPGQTIRAMLRVERLKHDGVLSFGKEESGRNLPHGVFVDNIGLNGLLLLAGQSDREFFITAAKWVQPMRRTFFLKSNIDGITSLPVTLEVVEDADAVRTASMD
jgi:WD40 repeat protein